MTDNDKTPVFLKIFNHKKYYKVYFITVLMFVILFSSVSCEQAFYLSELLDGSEGKGLEISPVSAQIVEGKFITFKVSGGVPPYEFELSDPLSGSGELLPDSEYKYTAPLDVTDDVIITITTTDLYGSEISAKVTVIEASGTEEAELSLSPATITLNLSDSITLTASGGTAPYTFSLESGLGGTGEDLTDSVYTAPSDKKGTVTVRVSDSDSAICDSIITIIPASELAIIPISLDLDTGKNFTFTGTGGVPPYSFSLITGGSGSPIIDSESGEYTAGESTGIDVIRLTDNSGESVDSTISVTVTASSVVTSDTDYVIENISHTYSSYNTEASNLETFRFTNEGADSGAYSVYWTAYISEDQTLDTNTDTVMNNGLSVALSGGATSSDIAIEGQWPDSAGSYYLLIRAYSADDSDQYNDYTASSVFTVTSTTEVVDYKVHNITKEYPTVTAGSYCGETFDISNIGGTGGTEEITWTAYASTDTIIDSEEPLGSGTVDGLDSGSSYSSIPIAGGDYDGKWPETEGDYYLIIEIETDSDDTLTGNNTNYSGIFTVKEPPDYKISSVTIPDIEAQTDSTLSDYGAYEFIITENGNSDGSQPIGWEVYASIDTILDDNDEIIKTGSTAALDEGLSKTISFSDGSWPELGSYYYVIITIDASDDSNSVNDSYVSPSTISVPEIVTEEEEPYDNDGSYPDFLNTSNLPSPLLNKNLIKINGQSDLQGKNDTYEFTLGSDVTSIEVMADWTASGIENLLSIELRTSDKVWLWGLSNQDGLTVPSTGIPAVIPDLIGGETYYLKASFTDNDNLDTNYSIRILGKP